CAVFRATMMLYLRAKAVKEYRVEPYAGRINLFKAESPEWAAHHLADDLGWKQYCPDVTVWKITGGHEDAFQPANLATARRAVIEALGLGAQW
ncbi:MAG TPA: hypothetical protein VL244_15550, partial [Alphaproteobacteria bacterium]|nr:hypothetical protein [Alphaproteobacteria bacterium]